MLLSFFRNRKLMHKLIVTYLIIGVLPVASLGVFAYRAAEGYLEKQALLGMNETVRQAAANVDQELEKVRGFIDFMVYHPVVKKVAGRELGNMLNYTRELNENIEPTIWYYINIHRELKEVFFYSDYVGRQIGNFIYPSNEVRQTDWYREAKAGNQTLWRVDESGVLYASHAIQRSDNTTFAGVLRVRLDHDLLFAKLAGDSVGEGRYLIKDSSGSLIYNGGVNESLSAQIGEQRQQSIRVDGSMYVSTGVQIPNTAWTVYYVAPKNRVQVSSTDILGATVSVLLLSGIVLLALIWLFTRTLVKPIHALKRSIVSVENGDFQVPFRTASSDEIGELTASFDKMVRRIRILIQEVDEARTQEKEAELAALQAQINPHFLYNTLSLINWKAVRLEAPEISRAANMLSKFYRTSLNQGKAVTTVAEELANIQAYIEIQRMMHSEGLEVVFDIDEQALGCEIVHFVLQPIVENAIIHGLDEREEAGGLLIIRAELAVDAVVLTVQDNGAGMESSVCVSLLERESAGGYGLRNVHERIRFYCGESYGLRIASVLREGTTVTLAFPRSTSLAREASGAANAKIV
ncbi:cache domain-containing sensor histidine kinase [Paenibacillus methanolicus]|nr:sensor histidine kinase [Paenibacillus methanolicus]